MGPELPPNGVFLIGVFDCFHEGHFNLLWKASRLGRLTVGIVKDKAVKLQKGDNRPIYDEKFRQNLIGNLRMVYGTILLEDFSFPPEVFNEYEFIILGEDQQHLKNIKDIPHDKLIVFPRTPDVSTSAIVSKMKG